MFNKLFYLKYSQIKNFEKFENLKFFKFNLWKSKVKKLLKKQGQGGWPLAVLSAGLQFMVVVVNSNVYGE